MYYSITQEKQTGTTPLLLASAYKEGTTLSVGRTFTVTTAVARTFSVAASKDASGDNNFGVAKDITAIPGAIVDNIAVTLTRWKSGDYRFQGTQSGSTPATLSIPQTITLFIGTLTNYQNFKDGNGLPSGIQINAAVTNTAAVAPAGDVTLSYSILIRYT
jgi:hypothetical protein